MISLISALIGFLASAMPKILGYFQDIKDKAHELAMLQIQVELAKLNIEEKLDEAKIQGDTAQRDTVYKTFYTGGKFWDGAMQGTRILVTITLLFAYLWMQHMYWEAAMVSGLQDFDALAQCFTNEDQALLTICLSFFFGNQYFNRR